MTRLAQYGVIGARYHRVVVQSGMQINWSAVAMSQLAQYGVIGAIVAAAAMHHRVVVQEGGTFLAVS